MQMIFSYLMEYILDKISRQAHSLLFLVLLYRLDLELFSCILYLRKDCMGRNNLLFHPQIHPIVHIPYYKNIVSSLPPVLVLDLAAISLGRLNSLGAELGGPERLGNMVTHFLVSPHCWRSFNIDKISRQHFF
jgi:hypothetical protein